MRPAGIDTSVIVTFSPSSEPGRRLTPCTALAPRKADISRAGSRPAAHSPQSPPPHPRLKPPKAFASTRARAPSALTGRIAANDLIPAEGVTDDTALVVVSL
ncbi:hypothetical protein EDD94_7085 [Streptomyces sp. PanSC9]|nr:hypothetical protein EDD94_7085 [Streptomyces sp. PanSC9]